MSKIGCSNAGVKPSGTVCDAFDVTNMVCRLELGMCTLQRKVVLEHQVQAIEHVVPPASLGKVQIDLQMGLPSILSTDVNKYEPVTSSIAIMEKMAPSGDDAARNAYWENYKAMEYDMGMLVSLYSQLAPLTARMFSNVARARDALKVIRAQKFIRIKKSFYAGIRDSDRRVSDKEVENLVIADPQSQEAKQVWLDAQEAATLIASNRDSVLEYINVLKKRLDSASRELRMTSNQQG